MTGTSTLVRELASLPGRFALIEESVGVEDATAECERMLDTTRCSVGGLLAEESDPPSPRRIEQVLAPHALLVDIDVLFAPQLRVDPVALLRRLARSKPPRVAVWPGLLQGRRASYSEPAKADHYERTLDDVLVLRPSERMFPDEPCFAIERWQ